MICQWGMSEKIGPLSVGKRDEEVFMGRGMSSSEVYSEKVAQEVDNEIHRIVSEGYAKATKILTDYKDKLVDISEALLIKETLMSSEIDRIMNGEDIITEEEISAYKKRIEIAQSWSKDPDATVKSKTSDKSDKNEDHSQKADDSSSMDPVTQAT